MDSQGDPLTCRCTPGAADHAATRRGGRVVQRRGHRVVKRRSSIRRVLALVTVPGIAAACLVVPAAAQAASASVASLPSSFSFSGSGWGHGVGLSQSGARGQAQEGRTSTQILTHYFTGTQVKPVADAMDLRVNVQFDVASVRLRGEPLGSSGGRVEVNVAGRSYAFAARSVVTLRNAGSSVQVVSASKVIASGNPVVVRWSGTRDSGATGSLPSVLNLVGPTGSIDSSGHRYRYGKVEVRSRVNGAGVRTLSAVNSVRLHDEYLLGIGEMPSSWPMAALQAQTIAARNYALVRYQAGIRPGCWCHVFDDTRDQVFVGYGKEAGASGSRWRQAVLRTAVSATTGQAVLYRGGVAQTFYSSSTGGRTQNSEDVWGSASPYLRSVDDHWSRDKRYNPSFAAWGPRARTQQQVAKAFALPDVVRLDLTSRNASGAVRTAKAWSSKGAYAVLSGATFSQRLALTSRWNFVTGTTDPMAAKAPVAVPTAYALTTGVVPGAVVVPAGATVSGLVLPASASKGKRVVIQKWINRQWKPAASITVATNGRYTYRAAPSSRGNYLFRVWKPSDNCTAKGCATRGAVSAPLRLDTAQRYVVGASAASKRVKKGSFATIQGKVTPTRANSRVLLQRFTGGAWKTLGSATVRTSGRFTYATRPSGTGGFVYRVWKPSDQCASGVCLLKAAVSSTVTVTVA